MPQAVMHNLLSNAWKNTANTPEAKIRVYVDERGAVILRLRHWLGRGTAHHRRQGGETQAEAAAVPLKQQRRQHHDQQAHRAGHPRHFRRGTAPTVVCGNGSKSICSLRNAALTCTGYA